jgi:hypothetical protein
MYGDWKAIFMEQEKKETLRAWIEPWKPLRVPLIFNLRRDPYERAYFTSNTYYDWILPCSGPAICWTISGNFSGIPSEAESCKFHG